MTELILPGGDPRKRELLLPEHVADQVAKERAAKRRRAKWWSIRGLALCTCALCIDGTRARRASGYVDPLSLAGRVLKLETF